MSETPKPVNPASQRLLRMLSQNYAADVQEIATEACAIDGVDPKTHQLDVSTMTYVPR